MQIIYKDSDIIVLNKPAGQVVHPDANHREGTLVDELIKYCPTIKDAISDPDNPISRARPGIVHRLDRETSGLIVVAKNRNALLKLQDTIQKNKMTKIYQALLFGRLESKQTVESNIVRSSRNDRAMAISYNGRGRVSVSIFKPKQYLNYSWNLHSFVDSHRYTYLTLCDVEIKTGRTHQIRLQALSIGHPVIGDQMYQTKLSRNLSRDLKINRQFLHAAKLTFPHPRTGKMLRFESQLPDDLENILTRMSNYK